jgi:hypothetical protein
MHAVEFRADENMHIASFPFVEGKIMRRETL